MDAKVEMFQWVYQVGRDVRRDEVRGGVGWNKGSCCHYFEWWCCCCSLVQVKMIGKFVAYCNAVTWLVTLIHVLHQLDGHCFHHQNEPLKRQLLNN